MDMKKILQAFDGAASKPKVEGANDMKRFVSIVQEGAKVDSFVSNVKKSEKKAGHSDKEAENIAWATANKKGMLDNKNKKTEAIVTGFEEGSLGGDANGFLLAADDINDLVMSNVDKIKINANEEKLKDMMAKFNAFMSAYHSVGKEILQPDMFGESIAEGAMDELHAELNDKFNELAPGIEKHKDKAGAETLYNELKAIAKEYGAEYEFTRMCHIAQRSAHMDYDTNPGGFENWFWYLPLGDEIDEAGYRNRDAYQRDYDSSQTGFGKQSRAYQADGGANDEYNTPEYDPELERNRKETTMYNITIDGKAVNPKPILGRTNAIMWAKEQATTAGLDVKKAMLSPVKYGESVGESTVTELSKDTLSNYSDKADMDIVKKHRVRGPQSQAGDKDAVAKTDKKIDKRMTGIDKAAKRLNNEGLSFKDYVALTEASKQIEGK